MFDLFHKVHSKNQFLNVNACTMFASNRFNRCYLSIFLRVEFQFAKIVLCLKVKNWCDRYRVAVFIFSVAILLAMKFYTR
jgi:hypothetical protein